MKILIKKVNEFAVLPKLGSANAAGLDLSSVETLTIDPGATAVVATGLVVEFPHGFVAMVCPRSGLAAKNSITVLNAPGIVDSDYRGEVKVILVNHGSKAFDIVPGDRIAQLVIVPVSTQNFVLLEVDDLSETARGTGGLGSTGVSNTL